MKNRSSRRKNTLAGLQEGDELSRPAFGTWIGDHFGTQGAAGIDLDFNVAQRRVDRIHRF